MERQIIWILYLLEEEEKQSLWYAKNIYLMIETYIRSKFYIVLLMSLTLTVLGYFAPWEYPLSDLGPKGADRRKIWHAPQKLCKEKDLCVIFLKNCIFY